LKIDYYENCLTAEDYLYIHEHMHYELEPKAQIEQALTRSLFTVTAKENGMLIGMGRLVGDGVMYCYIQDVRVLPDYQNKGIGTGIVRRLVDYVRLHGLPKTGISIGLTSAVGREHFYERLGFVRHPNADIGYGMVLDINI
jgi:GNAT superfamily N-acetyltransferase